MPRITLVTGRVTSSAKWSSPEAEARYYQLHRMAKDEVQSIVDHYKSKIERLVATCMSYDYVITDKPQPEPEPETALSLLKEAAEQFRMYEASHYAKQTPEADAKAVVNAKLAIRLEAFINRET